MAFQNQPVQEQLWTDSDPVAQMFRDGHQGGLQYYGHEFNIKKNLKIVAWLYPGWSEHSFQLQLF